MRIETSTSLFANRAPRKRVGIWGGHGLDVVSMSLMLAGYEDGLDGATTLTDSGGDSGEMSRFDPRYAGLPALGDWIKCLKGLVRLSDRGLPKVQEWMNMPKIPMYSWCYDTLNDCNRDYLEVQGRLEKQLGIQLYGRVVPSGLGVAELRARTRSGKIYEQEHLLDDTSTSKDRVTRVYLDRPVQAHPYAVEALEQADQIFIGPGSFHGSISAALAPDGIQDAISRNQKAEIVVIGNLGSVRNETHGWRVGHYWSRLSQYIRRPQGPFDVFIAPDLSQDQFEQGYPEVAQAWEKVGSYFVGYEKEFKARRFGYNSPRVVRAPIFNVDRKKMKVTHDPHGLAGVWGDLWGRTPQVAFNRFLGHD